MLYHEFLARIEGSNEQIDSNRMVSPLITNYPHIIENVGKCPDPSSIPELCKNRVTCNKSCPPQRATLRAAKATATNSCSRMKCDLCLAAITEDKDALQCEGTCQSWFHRYCTGVSQSLFRTLASTDDNRTSVLTARTSTTKLLSMNSGPRWPLLELKLPNCELPLTPSVVAPTTAMPLPR